MDHADAVPVAELLDERRHLLDVACWMLGDSREAETVVAEAYRRWYGLPDAKRGQIAVPRYWLAKTAGAICLGLLARPSRGATEKDAERDRTKATLEEEVGRVLLDALDSLSPAEWAAFVLHDAFGTTSDAVAGLVGRPEPECAELADRAGRSLRTRRSHSTPPEVHDLVARTVRQACVDGDAELLGSLLCPDATAFFDGGGKVRALNRPVHGSRQVAHSLLTLLARHPRTALATHPVNGCTGLIARYGHQVAAVISFDIAERRVAQVWVVLNPDKLRSWNQNQNQPPAPGPWP
ncbi:RNA polymerase subunit sigma [Streptomyces sp. NPDC090493]|uniref:RNA polymerase subunit sigma n=1 Tax=Streptomyces sp. NPDC090493 TaxID=3365964 RepID=UPI003820D16C